MVLLRQEQIKEKINSAVEMVGAELVQYKGNFSGFNNRSAASGKSILSEEFSTDFLLPQTIGKRFTVKELQDKIRNAFHRLA